MSTSSTSIHRDGSLPEKEACQPSSVRTSLTLVTIAGCLAMVYMKGLNCSAKTQFFREIGANKLHFGLLGGIPMAMVFFQFLGAALGARMRRRKRTFMTCLIVGRTLMLGVVLLPLVTDLPASITMTGVICFMAIGAALNNYSVPLWFSWMADVIPRPILSRYWGARQRWMHITNTLMTLFVVAFLYYHPGPALLQYPILVTIAVAAGVIDIFLFLRVQEPESVGVPANRSIWSIMTEPLRDPSYRRFMLYTCWWAFAAMFAAAFMMLYLLSELGLSTWQASLVTCVQGLGTALAAKAWGRAADRHGHRPLMIICTSFKAVLPITYAFIDPSSVLWLLPIALLFDGTLNSGRMLASHGYMMTIAPQENRSMFVAAITGLAGICGGLSAMLAGFVMRGTDGMTIEFVGRTWTNFHLIFFVSAGLRMIAAVLACRVRQAESSQAFVVLDDVLGDWPTRVIRFPVGLYQRILPFTKDEVDRDDNDDA